VAFRARLERLDERCFFADDVCTGTPVQHDVDAEISTENILADVASCIGVVERLGNTLVSNPELDE